MRVLVTGGRDYDDYERVASVLGQLDVTTLAQGGASGADRMAALWCHEERIPCITYPADWAEHGKAAGPIRNARMLNDFRPDLVVAFPGGRGTAHMVGIARKAGYEVREADGMRIVINDEENELVIVMHSPGSYAPDAMDDLKSRALEAYREALTTQFGVYLAARSIVEKETETETEVPSE